MLAILLTALSGTAMGAAALLDFSIRLSGAILGFEWDAAGLALVITAVGTSVGGIVAGYFAFIKDRSKAVDARDLENLKFQAGRQDELMDRYETEVLYLRGRQAADAARLDQLEDLLRKALARIDELERENVRLKELA